MIHETLPSDVDLAKSMLGSGRSETEILAALASRGLDPPKAAALLDDLRHGRVPSTQLPFVTGPRRRRTDPAPPPWNADEPRKRSHRRKHRRSRIQWWFVVLLAVFACALVYAFLRMGADVSREAVDKAKHELPAGTGNK